MIYDMQYYVHCSHDNQKPEEIVAEIAKLTEVYKGSKHYTDAINQSNAV
jgi:hypothetical protein